MRYFFGAFRIPLICSVYESQIKGEKYELKFKLIQYSLVACWCPKENFKFQFRIDFKFIIFHNNKTLQLDANVLTT